MEPDKKQESNNPSEQKKQTEDFKNIPAASDKQNPPDIDKEDVEKGSKVNKDGKTDNTEKYFSLRNIQQAFQFILKGLFI